MEPRAQLRGVEELSEPLRGIPATHHAETARQLAAARKQTPVSLHASRVAWGQKWGAILSALAAEQRRQRG